MAFIDDPAIYGEVPVQVALEIDGGFHSDEEAYQGVGDFYSRVKVLIETEFPNFQISRSGVTYGVPPEPEGDGA